MSPDRCLLFHIRIVGIHRKKDAKVEADYTSGNSAIQKLSEDENSLAEARYYLQRSTEKDGGNAKFTRSGDVQIPYAPQRDEEHCDIRQRIKG